MFFLPIQQTNLYSVYNDTISPRLCKLTEDDELDSEVPVITTTHHYHPFNFLHFSSTMRIPSVKMNYHNPMEACKKYRDQFIRSDDTYIYNIIKDTMPEIVSAHI